MNTPLCGTLNRLNGGNSNQNNNVVPMPTLYSSDGQRKPKLTLVELVLYNMASMLAGVASGYDVRISNVLPLHPKLHPQNLLLNNPQHQTQTDNEFIQDRAYAHHTYHEPSKHYR